MFPPNIRSFRTAPGWLMVLWLCLASTGSLAAQTVTFYLKSGDRVSGRIISETTNQVVVSNAWVKALSIPRDKILKLTRPAPARRSKLVVVKALLKAPAKSKGVWHGQINVGLNAIFNTANQQDYFGHINLIYLRPYLSDSKKFFRNTSRFDGEYQRTDGAVSANHVYASNKSDFDLWDRYYAYGLIGAGYDDIQKINFQYQVGPGAGLHLIQDTHFALNTEAGLNYEAQYRQGISNLKTFYLRLAEDFTWAIRKNLKWTENFAFYPDMENLGQYHNDLTSTLSYGFWKHLSLNLTVLNQYNTDLAPGVNPNQFEIRSSLGFTF